jgi:hypothetical protein
MTEMSSDIPTLEPMDEAADGGEFSMAARVVLAALSAGAGAIHLAMIAPHAQGSTLEGWLFAGAGWAQLTLAFFLFARPSRKLLGVTILANLAFLGAWAISRTVGLPFGENPGEAEDIGSVDLACAVMEGLVIVGAAVVAWRPRIGENIKRGGLALAAGIPVLAVMAVSSATLASPDGVHSHAAGDEHGHGSELATGAEGEHAALDTLCSTFDPTADHATMNDDQMAAWVATNQLCATNSEHDHGGSGGTEATGEVAQADRCDGNFNIKSYWEEEEITGASSSVTGHHHDEGTLEHNASGMHEGEAAALVVDLSEMSDAEYDEWLRNLNPATRDPNAPDDTGSGGHMGAQPWIPMTDQAECDALAAELQDAQDVALALPTVADAKKAGYFMVAPYVPGIASHWMNFRYVDGQFDLEHPEMILYDGNDDNAQVVGLSYYLIDPGEEQPTDGFVSDNDLYHRHIGLCIKNGQVIADTSVTDEECAALGGTKSGGQAGWMSHAWVVPGCESPWGVFSAANPVLDRVLVDHEGEGAPCSGSSVVDRYDRTPGFPEDGADDQEASGN